MLARDEAKDDDDDIFTTEQWMWFSFQIGTKMFPPLFLTIDVFCVGFCSSSSSHQFFLFHFLSPFFSFFLESIYLHTENCGKKNIFNLSIHIWSLSGPTLILFLFDPVGFYQTVHDSRSTTFSACLRRKKGNAACAFNIFWGEGETKNWQVTAIWLHATWPIPYITNTFELKESRCVSTWQNRPRGKKNLFYRYNTNSSRSTVGLLRCCDVGR